jgi:catechol 2,3-dioxygenase-like lactoylglutathione lyase family enzyme
MEIKMSYIALATDSFDEVVFFYGQLLGFPVVAEWDRPNGRGRRYDLGGLRLEILDNSRERQRLELSSPGERTHIVVEVDDLELVRSRLLVTTPDPHTVSWGAQLFQLRDPDGIPVTFLKWLP